MRIGKTQSPGSQGINIRSFDQAPFATVTTDVTDSQVVSQDENNIRLRRLRRSHKRTVKCYLVLP